MINMDQRIFRIGLYILHINIIIYYNYIAI